MSVTKSVTIQFVAITAGADLILQLDSEANDEKTSFNYGEKAHFQAFSHPTTMVLSLTPTDGVISNEGSGTSDEEDEIVTFVDPDEGNVSKPVHSITSYSWLGTSLGSVSSDGTTKIKTSQKGTGVLKITYKSNFRRYGLVLSTKDEESYPVIVVVVGTVT